ncbi:metallophosphoesterase [Clostridium sp. ZS2-4]|uniref:metallophosphoesterase n=1 Tax=Clostridium sp. ZS2-4 TaxID=2987703 RepID=UPI00227B4BE4|nr:metallophosphoesterase [Clostridium sp. ZS2-4]MCY6356011.1 metallophosphoesterase [Clostridium sp. ZS2-4]
MNIETLVNEVKNLSQLSFIHLSDIHFVKSSNDPSDIDKDLREAIINDLEINGRENLKNVAGILVTGDIAFSGNIEEYEIAKEYLNRVCDVFHIKPSDVYCVPGNHDVNQNVVNSSDLIFAAQNAVDEKETIDDADKTFSKYISDNNFNALFKPIDEYNEFAKRFECDISADKIFWQKDFVLEENLKLRVVGINSSFLSNRTDHQKDKPDRLMYIGQAQIPCYETDVATLLMCHHPPQCWKFKDHILQRINKRADIQLYGHMHSQSVEIMDENAILYSGAVHPTRTVDWLPRYNWITISSKTETDERILEVEIYPRCLTADRDSFAIDSTCAFGENHISHEINIDRKRKSALQDRKREAFVKDEIELCTQSMSVTETSAPIDERKIIYDFYELSWIEQINILTQLSLITKETSATLDSKMIGEAINRAREQDRLFELHNKILNKMEGNL